MRQIKTFKKEKNNDKKSIKLLFKENYYFVYYITDSFIIKNRKYSRQVINFS